MASKNERSRTPVRTPKMTNKHTNEKQKTTSGNKNTLLKVKMTKEEHTDYHKQSVKAKKDNTKPVSSNGLPTNSTKKAPIKSKRVH